MRRPPRCGRGGDLAGDRRVSSRATFQIRRAVPPLNPGKSLAVSGRCRGTIRSTVPQQEHAPNLRRIFLCHSKGDKEWVRALHRQLRDDGFNPWFDEHDLLPGQEWQLEIPRAVRSSAVVLVCLSQTSVNKAGFVQKEIKYALDVADEQPEDAIFIIPVRLEQCNVPERLGKWQWVDLFENDGYERILKALARKGLLPRPRNQQYLQFASFVPSVAAGVAFVKWL